MEDLTLVHELEDLIQTSPETELRTVKARLRTIYRSFKHPNPARVPVLLVKSPSQAIAEVAKIYRQAMNKVEDGFMLKLQIPNADPILVKSGVRYPTFLKWDFAAAMYRTNTYVKTDIWGYSEYARADGATRLRQISRDVGNMIRIHLEDWKRWSEAGENVQVFRDNTGYWPIARAAAFGRARTFPGSALSRMTLQRERETELTRRMDELSRMAFLIYPYDNFAIVLEFPEAIHMDGQGRLGKLGGPAIEWRDGTGTYVVAGRSVPKDAATGRLTFKKITKQNNAEVKRVLISHFGEERFLKEINAKEIARDEYGVLYHAPAFTGERETFAMVAVTNSTPEPDGTYKNYYLRVSPRAQTPAAAVGQSFRIDEQGQLTDWRLQEQIGREGMKYEPYAES